MKFPHLEKLLWCCDFEKYSKDDVRRAVEADFAELTAARDTSPELVEAERRLRTEAATAHESLGRKQCATIDAELGRLRARIAVLEAEESEAETRGRRQAFEEMIVEACSRCDMELAGWARTMSDACGKDVRR
jgi:hypothetical protein